MLTLTLPYPPSVNTYWRRNGSRYFVSAKGVKFRDAVKDCLCEPGDTITGLVKLTILAYPPDRRKRDIDNIAKGVLDSLAHWKVFNDDNQVAKLVIERMEVQSPGKCVVTIEALELSR